MSDDDLNPHLEARLSSIERSIENNLRPMQSAIIELKEAVVRLADTQTRIKDLTQEVKEIATAQVSVAERTGVLETQMKELSWTKKLFPTVAAFLALFTLGLGWAVMQLEYIHERDIAQLSREHVRVPYNPKISNVPRTID